MNWNKLKETLSTREKEFEEGKNLATAIPIYVVYSRVENFIEGWQEMPSIGIGDTQYEMGFINPDEDYSFREYDGENEEYKFPEHKATRFLSDRAIAFFLTSKGANDYLKYQRHNMNEPFIYVHSAGYDNREMASIFTSQA